MRHFCSLLLLTTLIAIGGCQSASYQTVSPEEFSQIISSQNDVQLLDVRTPAEYAEGHLPGAMLIDIKAGKFAEQAAQQLHHSHPVAVYCRSGKRSAMAADTLAALGFKVLNLNGGITAWQEQGLPIVIE